MIKTITLILLCFSMISSAYTAILKRKAVFTEKKPLTFLNFENKEELNNLNGAYGIFNADPEDKESFINASKKKDKSLNKKGNYYFIKYDVDSSKPSFCGLWTKLNDVNISDFKALSLKIKGDKNLGFNEEFKIELKDKSTKIETVVEGITSKWQKIVIPFTEFEGDFENLDFKNISEFTIVLEDNRFSKKVGAYYIDDISFIPKKNKKIKLSTIIDVKKLKPQKKKK